MVTKDKNTSLVTGMYRYKIENMNIPWMLSELISKANLFVHLLEKRLRVNTAVSRKREARETLPGAPGQPDSPVSPLCPGGPGDPGKPSWPLLPSSPGSPLHPVGKFMMMVVKTSACTSHEPPLGSSPLGGHGICPSA